MSVDWSYYDNPEIERINDMYLPSSGEGDNMGTQIVTAVNKLIYKWYNDGDVYDNTGFLSGWYNDLSSYANWLYKYVPKLRMTLLGIFDCYDDSEYEDLLKEIADSIFDSEDIENWSKKPKVGSIYDCDGPFEYEDPEDVDEDDYEDEDYEDEDEDEDEEDY